MSEMKAAEPHSPTVGEKPALHDEHPVDFNSYLRRCATILVVVFCAVSLMIWASFLNLGWGAKVGIILCIAAVNAFFVAGFLMHLLSEKKMVYTVLGFTVAFVIGLFGLTIWAMSDFPRGTIMH